MRRIVVSTALLALFFAVQSDGGQTTAKYSNPANVLPVEPVSSGLALADSSPLVAITAPKANGMVDETDEVDGKLTNPGHAWPVVLVKPAGDQPYYVQDEVTSIASSGEFTAKAHFGIQSTPSGTKFKIVIAMAPSQADAGKLKQGTALDTPPAGWPKSEPVNVVRN